jgi:hypothetical protein
MRPIIDFPVAPGAPHDVIVFCKMENRANGKQRLPVLICISHDIHITGAPPELKQPPYNQRAKKITKVVRVPIDRQSPE